MIKELCYSFNTLKHYKEFNNKTNIHTNIEDFRKENDANNRFIITCEHATNNMHQYFSQLSSNDQTFLNTHWAYDPGAKDVAINIAKKSNTLLIFPNFSRLILDPNRSLISSTLIRETVEGSIKLDINTNINDQKRNERLETFYYPYYTMVNEVFNALKPRYFISVHSFTQHYENNEPRDYEIGLLYNNRNVLIDKLMVKLEFNKIPFRHNEPYSANLCNAFNIMESYDYPNLSVGVCLEIRNDKATNSEFQKLISDIVNEVINEVTEDEDKLNKSI